LDLKDDDDDPTDEDAGAMPAPRLDYVAFQAEPVERLARRLGR
jgi:hypothetical protein